MDKSARAAAIEQHLAAALQPTHLTLIDESHLHIGHAGSQGGGSHFALEIASPLFQNKSLLQCHQLIYQTLAELMANDIHALRIKVIR